MQVASPAKAIAEPYPDLRQAWIGAILQVPRVREYVEGCAAKDEWGTITMETCKTCLWWEGRGKETVSKRRGCVHPKIGESHAISSAGNWDATDVLEYPYDEGGQIATGPDFGCIHHQPIEAELEEGKDG